MEEKYGIFDGDQENFFKWNKANYDNKLFLKYTVIQQGLLLVFFLTFTCAVLTIFPLAFTVISIPQGLPCFGVFNKYQTTKIQIIVNKAGLHRNQ